MKLCDAKNCQSKAAATTYAVSVMNDDNQEDEISYEVDLCDWHLQQLGSVLMEQFGLPADSLRITDQSGHDA